MKKIMVFVLVCAMLTVFVCGCGQPASETTSQAPEQTQESTAPAESGDGPQWDYSSIEVFEDDPMFGNGYVLYSDLQEIWGADVPVPEGPVNIGYVGKSFENEYWRMIKEGLEEEAARLTEAGFDVTLDIRAGQGEDDTEGQLSIMRDMINKQYDAIIIAPITDANLVPGVEEAEAAGIPIIPQSIIFDESPYVPYYIGLSAYSEGALSAQRMAEMIGEEGGEVAIITGIPNSRSAIGRTEGFEQYFEAHPELNITVVDEQNAEWDRMLARDAADILIKKYPNLKGIYCNNDTMAMGALEAARGADKIGEIIIGGTDATSEAIQSIQNGELSFTVNSYPYYLGKMALEMAFRVLNGQNLPERIVCYELICDSTNASADAAETTGWVDLKYVKASEYNANK